MTTRTSFDAARDMTTVYSPAGDPALVTYLNASDLVAHHGYMWGQTPPLDDVAEIDPAAVEVAALLSGDFEIAPDDADDAADDAEDDTAEDDTAEDDGETTDPVVEERPTLAEEAKTIAGLDDVAQYLEGFSNEALRKIAEDRYGIRLHHRSAKDTLIERIVALELEANGSN